MLEEAVAEQSAPKSDLECYHVRFEKVFYDPKNGQKLSTPSLQKYNAKEWGADPSKGIQDYLRRGGYEYTVLYNPQKEKSAPKGGRKKKEAVQEADTEPEN